MFNNITFVTFLLLFVYYLLLLFVILLFIRTLTRIVSKEYHTLNDLLKYKV